MEIWNIFVANLQTVWEFELSCNTHLQIPAMLLLNFLMVATRREVAPELEITGGGATLIIVVTPGCNFKYSGKPD